MERPLISERRGHSIDRPPRFMTRPRFPIRSLERREYTSRGENYISDRSSVFRGRGMPRGIRGMPPSRGIFLGERGMPRGMRGMPPSRGIFLGERGMPRGMRGMPPSRAMFLGERDLPSMRGRRGTRFG